MSVYRRTPLVLVSLCILILGLRPLGAASPYDALVFYQGSSVIGMVEAVSPGQVYTVPNSLLANPNFVQQVLLYPPLADLSTPFLADIYGILEAQNPNDPAVLDPYLFLISDVLIAGLDINNPPPGVIPFPDVLMAYDASMFLSSDVQQLGITAQFEHGVSVPDGGSTLLLLCLAFGAVGILQRRK